MSDPVSTHRVQRRRFEPSESFRPAAYLNSPHAQTLFAALRRPVKGPALLRERWDTPDGDFVDIDFLPAPAQAPASSRATRSPYPVIRRVPTIATAGA